MSLAQERLEDNSEELNEWFWDLAEAKARLAKLKVADLRILAKHYWGKHCGADEMPKGDLIEELADELVRDER